MAQGYPSHVQHQQYAHALQAQAHAQSQFHAQMVAQQAQAQQAQAMAQQQNAANGQFRAETPNGRAMSAQQHYMQQIQASGEAGSPSTEGSLKRGAPGPNVGSPVDIPAKRAKMAGKRPSKSCHEWDRALILAPEEHQRQAMEVAQKAAMQNMQAPPIQRQPSQVRFTMTEYEDVTDNQPAAPQRQMSDAERQYAARSAAYARQQVMNSPATFAASPTNQSPASTQGGFDVGVNGMSAKKKPGPPGLSVDVEGAATAQGLDGVEMTPVSAASTTTGTGKKKSSGKKATAKSKKGAAAASSASASAAKEDFAIPSTPTHIHPGVQGQEMLFNPQAGSDAPGVAMSRSGTLESIGVASGGVELGTPVNAHSVIPQHPPPAHTQADHSAPMADGSNGPSMQDLAGVDDEMFNNLFASYTESGNDEMPLSANMLNFDDYNVRAGS